MLATLDDTIVRTWSTVVAHTGGDDDYYRLCVLPSGFAFVLFWTLNIPLLLFNFIPALSPIERFKIQKGRHEPKEKVVWMILLVLFNQGLAAGLQLVPGGCTAKEQGVAAGLSGVPTALSLAWQLPACAMIYDVMFFFVHCTMHTKWLYRNVHYVHHRSKITIGISSAYFHPVDYVLSGLAVMVPPLLVSTHVLTTFCWLVLFMLETTNAHCGYRLPLLPDARDHDFHHSHSFYSSKKYRFVNMGAFLLIWDRLLGTRKPCLDWWAANPAGLRKGAAAPVESDGGKAEHAD